MPINGGLFGIPKFHVALVPTPITASVELAVAETEPGVKGDTVSNVTKPATLETGAVVQVPLFVNVGERVKVDPREARYISRA